MVKLAKGFVFGSKAETLDSLQTALTCSKVPEFMYFTLEHWIADAESVLKTVSEQATDNTKVIVRSSARNEDGELFAQAGAFLSVPHIDPKDPVELRGAINDVFQSYGADPENPNLEDQVLVQKMVGNVSMSGVVFTQVLSSGAPYYVINYDDETGSTDSVTSGTGYANRTIYIYRDYWAEVESPRFLKLIAAVREIEKLTEDGCLDIEFALDEQQNVYLFQVRRITTQPNWSRGLSLRIGDAIDRLRTTVGPQLIHSSPASEKGTVLGKMPDWNPAEIIGNAPRQLAFSLYRHVITDSAWRLARAQMGYHEPRGKNLMVSCAGQPYINVKHSFSSYLPADLDQALAERLVNHWLEQLAQNKHLHDKVEFEVAITTWSFDFDKRAKKLLPAELTTAEIDHIRESFRRLTIALVEGDRASLDEQTAALHELQRCYDATTTSSPQPNVELVTELLEDAITFGTIPFSVQARHGFIARTLLDSLVAEDLLTEAEKDLFGQSIYSVAGEFIEETHKLANNEISEDELFAVYGHLRPGTYDILSLRYDQRGQAVLGDSGTKSDKPPELATFQISPEKMAAIDARLKKEGFSIGAKELFAYCTEATQGREWAKLIFTRSISDSLEVIAAWGLRQGLSREELSHLDLRDILNCQVEAFGRSTEEHLRDLSEKGQRKHEVTSGIRLPYVLAKSSDIYVVPMLLEQPNFITLSQIQGPCIQVSGRDVDPEALDGQIVAIESADPGFDWIFTRRILGLVTKFGGANSHMAIRCAEFNIPAAIGCGEQIFERVVRSHYIELDCAVGTIEPVEH